jgi:hypothetical protein
MQRCVLRQRVIHNYFPKALSPPRLSKLTLVAKTVAEADACQTSVKPYSRVHNPPSNVSCPVDLTAALATFGHVFAPLLSPPEAPAHTRPATLFLGTVKHPHVASSSAETIHSLPELIYLGFCTTLDLDFPTL